MPVGVVVANQKVGTLTLLLVLVVVPRPLCAGPSRTSILCRLRVVQGLVIVMKRTSGAKRAVVGRRIILVGVTMAAEIGISLVGLVEINGQEEGLV